MNQPPFKIVIHLLIVGLLTGLIGLFADGPAYQYEEPDLAQIKLSFLHRGQRIGECRRLTREQMEALPPHMRRPTECPRERLPVAVLIQVDGVTLYERSLAATGLFGDGAARAYGRILLPPGPHQIRVAIRDSAREHGYDHEREAEITLMPGQNFVVDFDRQTSRIVFR